MLETRQSQKVQAPVRGGPGQGSKQDSRTCCTLEWSPLTWLNILSDLFSAGCNHVWNNWFAQNYDSMALLLLPTDIVCKKQDCKFVQLLGKLLRCFSWTVRLNKVGHVKFVSTNQNYESWMIFVKNAVISKGVMMLCVL